MAKDLPVPIAFRLPNDAWRPEPPEAYGVSNAAFLALRHGLPEEYRPSLVVSGDVRSDGADVTDIADEAVALLAQEAGAPVEVRDRSVVESEHAPGVAQRLAVAATVGGTTQELLQVQLLTAYVGVADAAADGPPRQAVVVHTLSCMASQAEVVEPEFREYLRSVRLEPPAGADR